jgi:hypothetical protein
MHPARLAMASPNFHMAAQSPLTQSVIQPKTSTPVKLSIAALIQADGLT